MTFMVHCDSNFALKTLILQNDQKWEKMNGQSGILVLTVEISTNNQP